MSPPSRSTVTVRGNSTLDPRLKRKNPQNGDEIVSSSTTAGFSHTSVTTSSTSVPETATVSNSDSKQLSDYVSVFDYQAEKCPWMVDFDVHDDRASIETKVTDHIYYTTITEHSIRSLGRFFLRGYAMHKQKVVRAWQQCVLKIVRPGPFEYVGSCQERLLSAFKVMNEAIATARENRSSFLSDITIFGPSTFFYAGFISLDKTRLTLAKMLNLWSYHHYFKDRVISRFCDAFDEGAHYGKICGRKYEFDDSGLWQNDSFKSYFISLLKFYEQNMECIVADRVRFKDLIEETGRTVKELNSLVKHCKLTSNLSALQNINERMHNLHNHLNSVNDDYYYATSVLIQLMMLTRFCKNNTYDSSFEDDDDFFE